MTTQIEPKLNPAPKQAAPAAPEQPKKKRGLNLPNQLTMFRMLLVPAMVAAFSFNHWLSWWNYLAAGIFFVADMTDIVDGWIARKYNLVTNFGKLWDPIADKALTGMGFIGLSILGELPWLITVIILLREWGITILRFWILKYGTVMAANKGGKLKTVTQIIGIIMLILNIPGAMLVMWVAVFLTVWSGISYLVKNVDMLA